MKLGITGHRPHKLWNDYDLKTPQMAKLQAHITTKVRELAPEEGWSGMALGIDTLFAKICLFLNIPLVACIPCKNQDKLWPRKSKDLYHQILEQCSKIIIVSEGEYQHWMMQRRNEYLVDHIDELMSVWDGTPGGTANCTNYASSKGKIIIPINPKDFS